MVNTEYTKISEDIVEIKRFNEIIEKKSKTELEREKTQLENKLAEINEALGVFV